MSESNAAPDYDTPSAAVDDPATPSYDEADKTYTYTGPDGDEPEDDGQPIEPEPEPEPTFAAGRDEDPAEGEERDEDDDTYIDPEHTASDYSTATISLEDGQIGVEVEGIEDGEGEHSPVDEVDEDTRQATIAAIRHERRAGFEPERPLRDIDTESLLLLSGQIRQELANR